MRNAIPIPPPPYGAEGTIYDPIIEHFEHHLQGYSLSSLANNTITAWNSMREHAAIASDGHISNVSLYETYKSALSRNLFVVSNLLHWYATQSTGRRVNEEGMVVGQWPRNLPQVSHIYRAYDDTAAHIEAYLSMTMAAPSQDGGPSAVYNAEHWWPYKAFRNTTAACRLITGKEEELGIEKRTMIRNSVHIGLLPQLYS